MGERSRIAARYARALFDLAREQERLDAVYEDMVALRRIIDESAALQGVVTDPSMPAPRVLNILKELFEPNTDPLTYRFLRFLVHRNRLAWLPDAIPLFEQYVDEHKGQLRVNVVSAVSLSEKQKSAMNAKLKRRFKREILARYEEQPALVGGFRVQVGDTVHDYSAATMLETFKHKLMNA